MIPGTDLRTPAATMHSPASTRHTGKPAGTSSHSPGRRVTPRSSTWLAEQVSRPRQSSPRPFFRARCMHPVGQRPLGPKARRFTRSCALRSVAHSPGSCKGQALLALTGKDPPALATSTREAVIRRDGKGGHRLDDGAADAIAMGLPHFGPVRPVSPLRGEPTGRRSRAPRPGQAPSRTTGNWCPAQDQR